MNSGARQSPCAGTGRNLHRIQIAETLTILGAPSAWEMKMEQPIDKQLAGLLGRLLLACAFLAVMTNKVYPALAMTLIGIVLVGYAAPIKRRSPDQQQQQHKEQQP